ncbi:CMRF35-like molecule 3 isoform X2 [Cololabis saira]|uniref:CMRF35-like molecule 3 isoform X2 n=1 Tax=Cololabis saira TaxID=129043 RepID=UPI002AD30A7A|nr:CMRF35-like molecule 3 isoform X2 [Cololabis saira]
MINWKLHYFAKCVVLNWVERMKFFVFVAFCCFSVVCLGASDMLEVSGHVGGNVSIPCFGSWTTDDGSEDNRVYFCRGVCSGENTFIQTKMKRFARRGRYSMEFGGRDGVFTVTIRRLRKADTGSYHCGMERSFNLSYQEVNLKVLDASTVPSGSPPSAPTILQMEEHIPAQGIFSSSTEPAVFTLPPSKGKKKHQKANKLTETTLVIIISCSLAILVCAIIPLIFYKRWRSNAGEDTSAELKAEC